MILFYCRISVVLKMSQTLCMNIHRFLYKIRASISLRLYKLNTLLLRKQKLSRNFFFSLHEKTCSCRQKKSFKLVWRCYQLLPLAPSVTSITSIAKYKDNNEMIPGEVHKSPGICLTSQKTPENLS